MTTPFSLIANKHMFIVYDVYVVLCCSRLVAVQALAQLLEKDDCHLLSVCLEDSHLKELAGPVLESLAENHSLTSINLKSVITVEY